MQNVRTHSATALAIVALVLASMVGYQFLTTESLQSKVAALEVNVSSISQSCKQYYTKIAQNVLAATFQVNNVTSTLLARIQADNATIAMLNSTKPPGYQSVIDTLSSDIKQDQSAIRILQDAFAVREGIFYGPPPKPCG